MLWIEAGQAPAEFWTFTLSEIGLILKAAATRRDEATERQRALAHELAGLIAVGFHNPKEMPEYKPLRDRTEAVGEPTEHDDARIRGFFMLQAMRSSE